MHNIEPAATALRGDGQPCCASSPLGQDAVGVGPDDKGDIPFADNMVGRLMQQSPGGVAAAVATLGPGAGDMEVVLDQGLTLVPVTPANTIVCLNWTD